MAGNTRHVVNMANSIVGVSILSMPYCFKESGLLLGVVMVLVSGLITKKTCMFLVRAATMARHHSYEFLAFHVFGVRGKLFVEVCMILFLVGICISFHVVMGDLAPALASSSLGLTNTPSLRATLLLGVAVLVVLPLCLLRKLDNLASMSACSILFYFFLITVIFVHALPRLVDGSWYQLARLWRPAGVLQVLPICVLGLSCQSNVFEIYESVQDADVPKMRAVVHRALNLCCALYIAVGFFGYVAFVDQDLAGNVIIHLPATPLTEGIKLFFTASLAISFPLMIFPCRTSIHSLVYCRNTQGYDLVRNYMPEARFKGITVGILAFSLVIGILIPNIEFVLGMLGSTMGVIISLVLPCVMFIKLNSKASAERLVAQGIMLMGVLLIVSGTYLNLTHAPPAPATPLGEPRPQEAVLPLPPALPPVMEREGDVGGELRRQQQHQEEKDEAPAVARPGQAAPGGDPATRREPVAPEPPPDEGGGPARDERGKAGVRERAGGEGEGLLHPDAIQREEKEAHREGGGGGGGQAAAAAGEVAEAAAAAASKEKSEDGVGAKQQALLDKMEVQHQEQQKILAQQKQILQELKDHKAQQELEDSLRAAAAVALPQQPAVPQQVVVQPLLPQQQVPVAAQVPIAAQQPPVQQLPVAAQLVPAAAPAQSQLDVVLQQQQQEIALAGQQLLPAAVAPPQPAAGAGVLPQQPQQVLAPAGGAPQQVLAPAGGAPQQVLAPAGGAPQQVLAPAGGAPQQQQQQQQQQPILAAPKHPAPGGGDSVGAAAAGGSAAQPAPVPAGGAARLAAAAAAVSAAPPRRQQQQQQHKSSPAAPRRPEVRAGKKGPAGYLEKVSKAAPSRPHPAPERRHDEERRKRAAGPEPGLADPAAEAELPRLALPAGAGAEAGAAAAFETRHLLAWGGTGRGARRRRRGGGRGGEPDYWDET